MNKALQLTHTRVGDIPLLLGLVIKLGIPEIYDREIGDHGSHVGLSGGWMLAIWIVFILTECDHTKYKVEEWSERHAALLSRLSGQQIRAVEFNDNRLSSLLSRLSKLERWERFEASIWQHSVSVYEILQPSVGKLHSAHCDSTTASGYHQVHENGVMQRGYSKDHRPDLAQLKLMSVAMHPYGHLIATQVASGQTADEGLYLPLIARARRMLGRVGVLYVGDSKMAVLATCAQIAYEGDYYLTVAPMRGEIPQVAPRLDRCGIEWRASFDNALQTDRRTDRLRLRVDASVHGANSDRAGWGARSLQLLRACASDSIRGSSSSAVEVAPGSAAEGAGGNQSADAGTGARPPSVPRGREFQSRACCRARKAQGRGTARSRLGGSRTEADTICWARTRWRRPPEARNCHTTLPGQERSIRPKGGRRRRTPTGLARAALERASRGFARDLRDALSRELARRTQLQPDQRRADRD